MATLAPVLIDHRYMLLGEIGRGGMSVVYRALDHLTNQYVALKRVSASAVALENGYTANEDVRLAAAQEFRLLATLRHPNIISVLDYGFDDGFDDPGYLPEQERQPYFSMDLLENASTILDVGRDLSAEGKVDLILQMLQALTYLHRRGIIHRDLKPHNVMVWEGQVKLLDFGLSINRGEVDSRTAGTLAYMPPEVLQGMPAAESSDLYAAGVMLYELFAGVHPYQTDDVMTLIQAVFEQEPDFSLMDAPPEIRRITARLLVRDLSHRYNDAQAVIIDLSRAMNRPVPPETVAIRESFLQAARLVGRDREMAILREVLAQAEAGHGASMLIGGESGIGKSRLVDELRSIALVSGVFVLRGQAVSDAGVAYQLWRGAIRWLCLIVDVTPEEAGILLNMVPDIEQLAGVLAEQPPSLEPDAARERLHIVIADLFRRLNDQPASLSELRPTLVILEDLHWAGSEDLALLRHLNRIVVELPLMIVGTFREEEVPDLPTMLPMMRFLHLNRLDRNGIAELTRSILGETGTRPQVIDLLRRETEGNVFFLLEVVRVLAEDAGRLDEIGTMTLPEQVFAGGVRQIVQRRLDKVPTEDRALLEIAAVIGRELDGKVLRAIAPEINWEHWLIVCADAAVIEVATSGTGDARWRFAHDKLREALLEDLAAEQKRALHAQVAHAIETVHQDNPQMIETYTPTLAYHWAQAQNLAKERQYTVAAGEQGLRTGAHREAVALLKRALELHDPKISDPLELAHLYRLLGQAQLSLGELEAAEAALVTSLKGLGYPVPHGGQRTRLILLREGLIALLRLIGLRPRRQRRDRTILLVAANSYERLAEIYFYGNDPLLTVASALRGLNLAERAGDSPELARAYANISVGVSMNGLPLNWLSHRYSRRALQVAATVRDPGATANVMILNGIYHAGRGNWDAAEQAIDASADLFQAVRDGKRMEQALTTHAHMASIVGDFARVISINERVLRAARVRGDRQMMGSALVWQAVGYMMQADLNHANALLAEAAPIYTHSRDIGLQIVAYGTMALLLRLQGDIEAALENGRIALDAMQASAPTSFSTLASYSGLAGMYLNMWTRQPTPAMDEIRRGSQIVLNALQAYSATFPIGRPITFVWHGLYQWRIGHPQRAHKLWRRGLRLAERQRNTLFIARAHYEIGRHLPPGTQRQEHLQTARRMLVELGLLLEIGSIDNLLNLQV